ncbi:MAG: hypothetical protein L3J20_09130 [Flavobacteriaceae bacterium]|nr:hypothetical protein [Flavobacteriaceae bacterium]
MIIFLYSVEGDYELKDEDLNLEESLTEFYELSDEKGSFFGVKTKNGIIQFAWENENKWLVDLPNPPSFLNLQRYASYDECVEIIKSIFKDVLPENIEDLVKVKIMEETLDTVLEKRE